MSLAVALVAYLGAMLLPKKYASNMSLYFPAAQAKASNALASLASGSGGGDGDSGSISHLNNTVTSPLVGSGPSSATGILLSRTCLAETASKLDLKTVWRTSTELAAVERLRSAVSVSTDKNGFLIISCTESDAELCQSIIRTMKAHLDRRAGELTLSLASSNRALVEKQYKKAEDEVVTAREALLGALAAGGPNSVDEAAKTYLQVRTRLVEVRSEAKSAGEKIATMERGLTSYYGNAKDANALENGIGTAPSAALSKLAEELETSRLSMAEVARKFTQSSPEYQLARKRLNDAEATSQTELKRQQARVKDGTSLRLLEAKSQLNALNKSVEVYENFLDDVSGQMRRLPERNARIQETQSIFDLTMQARARLKQELDRAILAELRDPSRYKVVDEPIVDPSPVSPRKGIIAAIFFLLAAATQFLLLGTKAAGKASEAGSYLDTNKNV